MPSKNISITEDAYGRLKVPKREKESFNELIVHLTETTDPMAFVGSCLGLAEYVETSIDELDADLNEKHNKLVG